MIGKSKRILVVDDESSMVEIVSYALEEAGYDVVIGKVPYGVAGATTVYIGDDKCSSGVDKTCYSLGGQRVAMTDGVLVRFDLADHLGSSTIDADGTAVKQAELRCGKERPFVKPRDLRGRPAVASGGALKEK